MISVLCMKVWGSSPLTRGGPDFNGKVQGRFGLIPAYAGRTLTIHKHGALVGAHPRLRGADGISWFLATAEEGSSPLTRGGLVGGGGCPLPFGLIPAYAGRTADYAVLLSGRWAHPRLRGADCPPLAAARPPWGSSPLTRGGPHRVLVRPAYRGLIPAYAGRTAGDWRFGVVYGAHPRLRGADQAMTVAKSPFEGSSPLTRGGPLAEAVAVGADGLIPAYAGRTGDVFVLVVGVQAHPRLRGADALATSRKVIPMGSSPLTRGGPRR